MPASATKVDTSDVSTDVEMLTHERFVLNTSMTLSPPVVGTVTASAPARTRVSMHEMLSDSSGYVSFTSPSVCPEKAADVEREWRQIVDAAETLIASSTTSSISELTDALSSSSENLVDSSSVYSDQRPTFAVGEPLMSAPSPLKSAPNPSNSAPMQSSKLAPGPSKLQQPPPPLSFANPLFIYRRQTSFDSAAGVSRSGSSGGMHKSSSLSSVVESSSVRGNPAAASADGAALVADQSSGPRHSVHIRQRVGNSGVQASQSKECLTDSTGNAAQPQIARHSAILSAAELTTQPSRLTGSHSHSTVLSDGSGIGTEQSTHNAVGLLDTPPDSPFSVSTNGHRATGNHKVRASQSNVRMGVCSVQRGREKSKIEVRPPVYFLA